MVASWIAGRQVQMSREARGESIGNWMQDAKVQSLRYSTAEILSRSVHAHGTEARRPYSHYPRLQMPDGARESSLAWGQHLRSRHQWRHNILRGDGSILPGLEVVEEVVMVAHLSIHRTLRQMCQ